MRLARLILPHSAAFERKQAALDAGGRWPDTIEWVDPAEAELVHVYGNPAADEAAVRRLGRPYIASAGLPKRRFAFRAAPPPRAVVVPVRGAAGTYVPEAINPVWFEAPGRSESATVSTRTVGSVLRGSVKSIVEQTVARLHRFREDVDWQLFDSAPAPEEMATLDAWIDPATLDDDFDGFVAEAAAAGLPVIASRTPINTQRLEKGRTGQLVPVNDPNEMTHAILAALFKPELIRPRLDASRQTIGKYRPVHRWRALSALYQSIVHDRSS